MAASSVGRGVGRDNRARRAFAWIAATAVLLALLLTGAWYYLADRLDEAVGTAIARAAGEGVTLTCGNRQVFGYPFRLGLRCDRLGIDAPGKLDAAAGALRTAGQIYDPTRVVAELGGPLALQTPNGPPLHVDWTLARASAHFWTQGLDRFAVVLDNPVVGIGRPAADGGGVAASDHLEVHARRNGGDLDLSVTDAGIRALAPDLSRLPRFDAALDATVDGAATWLSGQVPGETLGQALAGRTGTLRVLRLALAGIPDAASDLSGPFRIGGDGLVSGEFTLAVTDPQKIAGLLAAISPRSAGLAGSIASGIALAGKSENGRTVIRITVAEGDASVGFIPLGRIPPLR